MYHLFTAATIQKYKALRAMFTGVAHEGGDCCLQLKMNMLNEVGRVYIQCYNKPTYK